MNLTSEKATAITKRLLPRSTVQTFEVEANINEPLKELLSGALVATPKSVGLALRQLAEESFSKGGEFDASLVVRDGRVIGWGIDARSKTGIPMLRSAVMAMWVANIRAGAFDLSAEVKAEDASSKLYTIGQPDATAVGLAVWAGVKSIRGISARHVPADFREKVETRDRGPIHSRITSQLLDYGVDLKTEIKKSLLIDGFVQATDKETERTSTQKEKLSYPRPAWMQAFKQKYSHVNSPEGAAQLACDLASLNVANRDYGSCGDGGGPFGAIVYEIKTGKVFGVGANTVERGKAAFLHGETVAILDAVHSLAIQGCKLDASRLALATSAAPCAMCCGSIGAFAPRLLIESASVEDTEQNTFFSEGPVARGLSTWFAENKISRREGVKRELGVAALIDFTARLEKEGGKDYNSSNNEERRRKIETRKALKP